MLALFATAALRPRHGISWRFSQLIADLINIFEEVTMSSNKERRKFASHNSAMAFLDLMIECFWPILEFLRRCHGRDMKRT
jgi:hypothetical protein